MGSDVSLGLLQAATDRVPTVIEEQLIPALEDGLLVLARTGHGDTFRFRHDRVQQAAFTSLDAERRSELHLEIGRRLAGSAAFAAEASQQYLAVVDRVTAPEEQRAVAALFRTTALGVLLTSDALAERLLTATWNLLAPIERPQDAPAMFALQVDRHRALYILGELEEADEVYRDLRQRATDPIEMVEPALAQLASLALRNHRQESAAVGLGLLARLASWTDDGPAEDDPDGERLLAEILTWLSRLDLDRDLGRPPVDDPEVLRRAELLGAVVAPAFFGGVARVWPPLMLQAQRMWDRHGPCQPLIRPLALLAMKLAQRQDYRVAHNLAQHLMAISEARGWDVAAAWVRVFATGSTQHWFHPLPDILAASDHAREALLRAGERPPRQPHLPGLVPAGAGVPADAGRGLRLRRERPGVHRAYGELPRRRPAGRAATTHSGPCAGRPMAGGSTPTTPSPRRPVGRGCATTSSAGCAAMRTEP